MVSLFHQRSIAIRPILIGSQKKHNAANDYVVPNSNGQVVIAIQEGIDQGEKSKRRDNPVRNRDFLTPAREKPAKREGRNSKPQYQIFPKHFDNRSIYQLQNERGEHQP